MGKILIVDDSMLTRRMLKSILATTNHTVIEASGGEEAIKLYKEEKPDLVFLDLVMKDIHGLEVLRRLREIDYNCRVVIVTADIQKSTVKMAVEGGALGLINKPFSQEKILEYVERYL